MSEWYRVGRRVYHREAATLVATAERPEWAKEIAALPDLLAALEVVAAMAAHDRGDDHPAITQARAAIAKAKP